MAKNYEDLGLNEFFQSTNSLGAQESGFVTSMDFDSNHEIGGISNAFLQSGTLQFQPGVNFILKSNTSDAVQFIFERSDNPAESVKLYLVEGNASPRVFSIDPSASLSGGGDFRIGDVQEWNSFVINTNNDITLTGGNKTAGTTTDLILSNGNWKAAFGGTTMMSLKSNGDLHIRGTISQNDSTP